jgi:putative sigma-54 modulation protein
MNRQNNHELIVSGIHLDLTSSLKTYVREKAERLFRHEDRIVRIRVVVELDSNENVSTRFKAKGHSSDECHKAVSILTDKLDRMLRRRSRLKKEKRNNPHSIEFSDVALPKAV